MTRDFFRELRKTQRRCNALSKLFIPNYRETVAYIAGSLEEREERIILKMTRDRLADFGHHRQGCMVYFILRYD